jgi:hypothetical protein
VYYSTNIIAVKKQLGQALIFSSERRLSIGPCTTPSIGKKSLLHRDFFPVRMISPPHDKTRYFS